jgi:CRP-like cAMP-binding protein
VERGVDENGRMQALAGSRLLAGVHETDVRRLAAVATVRRYRRGQLLFYEGDPGDSLLLVVEGSLKAVSSSPHGDELLLAVIEPGETVGELAIADGGDRSATIAALTDAAVLRIPREALLAAIERSPALCRALLTSLAGTIRRLTGDAADLVFLDIPRRVAKLLLSLPRSDGDVVRLALTQTELAERVGSSRQTVNAALQNFQQRGWISVSAHQIRLVDPTALRRFVG